jgi:acetoin utilization protein AcuB
MSTTVLTAFKNTPLREIARVLFEERIGCLPIIDTAQKSIGILTRSDILRALMQGKPLDLWA